MSQGSGVVTVPNVQGQTREAAVSLLQGDPFEFIVTVVDEASTTVEKGRVVRTAPVIGAEGTKGGSLTLYVSSGPAPITVPPVTGLTEAQARAALTAKGFTVRVEEYIDVPAGSANDGRVISQTPSQNIDAPAGSQISLKVGKAVSAPTTVATTLAPTTTAAATTTTVAATTTTVRP